MAYSNASEHLSACSSSCRWRSTGWNLLRWQHFSWASEKFRARSIFCLSCHWHNILARWLCFAIQNQISYQAAGRNRSRIKSRQTREADDSNWNLQCSLHGASNHRDSMSSLRVEFLWWLDDNALMSMCHTKRRVAKATSLSHSDVKVFHDTRVRHHKWNLDLEWKNSRVMAKALEEVVRLETSRSFGCRTSSDKNATTSATSTIRARISSISVTSHSTICTNDGQHGIYQSPSSSSPCFKTSDEPCKC